MIKKVTMYQAVCDNCGITGADDIGVCIDKVSALQVALDSGWREIDGKLYCPDCYMVNDDGEYEVAIM